MFLIHNNFQDILLDVFFWFANIEMSIHGVCDGGKYPMFYFPEDGDFGFEFYEIRCKTWKNKSQSTWYVDYEHAAIKNYFDWRC